MSSKQILPKQKTPPLLLAAKVVLLVLTAIYPLFMTVMTGLGIIYNSGSYGSRFTAFAVLLIVSGLAVTAGTVLTVPKKRSLNIAAIVLTAVGLVLCMAVLYRMINHADRFGWQGMGKYADLPVSDMYRVRLLPVIFPAVIAAVTAAVQLIFFDEERSAK